VHSLGGFGITPANRGREEVLGHAQNRPVRFAVLIHSHEAYGPKVFPMFIHPGEASSGKSLQSVSGPESEFLPAYWLRPGFYRLAGYWCSGCLAALSQPIGTFETSKDFSSLKAYRFVGLKGQAANLAKDSGRVCDLQNTELDYKRPQHRPSPTRSCD
jgi:hypothetical protein